MGVTVHGNRKIRLLGQWRIDDEEKPGKNDGFVIMHEKGGKNLPRGRLVSALTKDCATSNNRQKFARARPNLRVLPNRSVATRSFSRSGDWDYPISLQHGTILDGTIRDEETGFIREPKDLPFPRKGISLVGRVLLDSH